MRRFSTHTKKFNSRQLYGNKKRKWTRPIIIEAIKKLPQKYSTWVKQNNNALWKAGVRYYGSWGAAVTAAGFDYDAIKHAGPPGAPPNKGTGGECNTPGCTRPHHAKGFCKHCYNRRLRSGLPMDSTEVDGSD